MCEEKRDTSTRDSSNDNYYSSVRLLQNLRSLTELNVKLSHNILTLSTTLVGYTKVGVPKKVIIWLITVIIAIIVGNMLSNLLFNEEGTYIQSCVADGKQLFYICYEKWFNIHTH